MKPNDKTNYFTRYLQKKHHQSLQIKHNFKGQSSDKTKSNPKRKQTEDTSTTQASQCYHNKIKQTHKKVLSTPLELIIPVKTEHQTKYSFEEELISNDHLNKKDTQSPPNEITVHQIKAIEAKILAILDIINDFEKENNLNAEGDCSKGNFLYEAEEAPLTERIVNKVKIIEYISPPNTIRLNRSNNFASHSTKESTSLFSKIQQQINKDALKKDLNDNESKNKDYKAMSMKKTKMMQLRLIGLKQNVVKGSKDKDKDKDKGKEEKDKEKEKDDGEKEEVMKQLRTMGNRDYKHSLTKLKGKYINQKEQKNKWKAYSNKYSKHQSQIRQSTNTNDNDSSINIIYDDNKLQHNNNILNNNNKSPSKRKSTLIAIPIKNFAKIKEQDHEGSSLPSSRIKCKSERNKHSKFHHKMM